MHVPLVFHATRDLGPTRGEISYDADLLLSADVIVRYVNTPGTLKHARNTTNVYASAAHTFTSLYSRRPGVLFIRIRSCHLLIYIFYFLTPPFMYRKLEYLYIFKFTIIYIYYIFEYLSEKSCFLFSFCLLFCFLTTLSMKTNKNCHWRNLPV